MKTIRELGLVGGFGVLVFFGWTSLVSAQTFSSGSTGALGVFNPSSNTTVTLPADGVLNYTTVTIPAGVTVTFTRNAANTPVTLLATGDVTVSGVISLNGNGGTAGQLSGSVFLAGGLGGPGGFNGGNGGARGATNNLGASGQGPGGGAAATTGGHGAGGTYGTSPSFVSLLPLFGGSGGGGGTAPSFGSDFYSGSSGGGGAGSIVIASSTRITVTGTVRANGGPRGEPAGGFGGLGGAGSGGAVRLVAPQITGTGTLSAVGGSQPLTSSGGNGLIRLEAFTQGFTGSSTPVPSTGSPGPVTAASTPALVNLPTLTISSVGSVAAPGTPGGSYTTADVALPLGTTNPVSVTLTVTNTPVGTIFTVRLLPQFGGTATNVTSTATAGTFASATATANVTFPTGAVSVLNAFGSFTLPTLTAALFPLIDGEPVDQILVAATYGAPSTVSLVTRSGKEMPVAKLSPEDQVRVMMAWEALQKSYQ